jgi:NAD(P)-dependent dehydrogenase (short-subunit alcohol dehydrogenase family)
MFDLDNLSILQVQTALFAVLLSALVVFTLSTTNMLFSKRLDFKDKFCYVPGGSAGLGKSLAAELVRRGAHVVIVARDAKRSAETIAELKAVAGDKERKIFAVSADLTQQKTSDVALSEACAAFGGKAPDYAFLCAGFSKPQMFIDATAEDLQSVSRVSTTRSTRSVRSAISVYFRHRGLALPPARRPWRLPKFPHSCSC